MKLIINSELKNKCGHGLSEYWFSFKTYTVESISNIAKDVMDNEEKKENYESTDMIPFLSISNEEIMRSFVNAKCSAKITNELHQLKGEAFIEAFWKYYNAYPEFKEGFENFIMEYATVRICRWCDENGIDYIFEDN